MWQRTVHTNVDCQRSRCARTVKSRQHMWALPFSLRYRVQFIDCLSFIVLVYSSSNFIGAKSLLCKVPFGVHYWYSNCSKYPSEKQSETNKQATYAAPHANDTRKRYVLSEWCTIRWQIVDECYTVHSWQCIRIKTIWDLWFVGRSNCANNITCIVHANNNNNWK